MNYDQMLQYRQQVCKNIEEVLKDIESLRADEDAVARAIHSLRTALDKVVEERAKAHHDVQMMSVKLGDGQSLIDRDSRELRFELNRQMSMLGAKVIFRALHKIIKKKKVAHFSFLVQ